MSNESLKQFDGKAFVIPAKFSPQRIDIRFICRVDGNDLILQEERKYILGYSHPDRYHMVKLYDGGKCVDTMGCTQNELNILTSSPKCSFGNMITTPMLTDFSSDSVYGKEWQDLLNNGANYSFHIWMESPFTQAQKQKLRELFHGVGQWDKIPKETLIGYEG